MASPARPWLVYAFTFYLLLCRALARPAESDDRAVVAAQPLAAQSRTSTPSRGVSHEHLEQLFSGDRIYSGQWVRPPEETPGRSKYELGELVLVTTVADGAIHAIKRETGQWIWTLHDSDAVRARSVLGPLVSTSSSESHPVMGGNASAGAVQQLPEETYIVEPGSGAIFLHLRSTGVMQKLPLTVPDIVDSSPFTFADDTTRMFVGRKTTKLVGIDLASGKIVGIFGPEAGWCEWRTRPGMAGEGAGQYECEDGIDSRPQDLLYMGRTEYHLSVYEKSGQLLQSLDYTSYHPSAMTSDAAAWTRAPDERYIQPLHDGSLICLRGGRPGLAWSSQFSSPVVGVFDVAFADSDNPQPLMLKHPLPPLPDDIDPNSPASGDTYVGRAGDNGTLYAMSRLQFPLVGMAGASPASTEVCTDADCLLGLHSLPNVDVVPPRDPAVRSRLGIDAAPSLPTGLPAAPTSDVPRLPAPSLPLTLPPVAASSSSDIALRIAVSIIACALVAFFWSKSRLASQAAEGGSARPLPVAVSSEGSEDGEEAITPPAHIPEHPRPVNFATYDKDLPPLPPPRPAGTVENGGDDGGAEGSDEEGSEHDEADTAGATQKRKKRRGKRGKKPGQRAAAAAAAAASAADLNGADPTATTVPIGSAESGAPAMKPIPIISTFDASLPAEKETRVGSLVISDQVLGLGSHGTVVLRGQFQGRAVAVKRMLKQLITVATHEVALLQETDEHANVIRYFCKEQRDNFLYIALELCPRSLADLVERPAACEPELVAALQPKQALRQITSGLAHLHRLKIVHRDIKPPNILVAQRRAPDGALRMLISDFGLCKRLDGDASSFHQTVSYDAAGSIGWRAPEVLRGDVDPNQNESSDSSSLSPSILPGVVEASQRPAKRLTRSLDIFSLGCLAYYLLSSGEHPFGGRYERESNILKARYALDKLDGLGEEAAEAQSMIASMIAATPSDRPSAEVLLLHPFFWSPSRRLHFICDASDRFETMERDPPDPVLVAVEAEAPKVVGADWLKALDRALIDNLGKYRKYDGASVRDLLRVIRNKKNHYQDLPEGVRRSLGSPPEAFLGYFTQRFPHLFLHIWHVVRDHLPHDELFRPYFAVDEV